ncbi:unnamed protein product [Tilletia controversa]|uniref:Uncharacterized protein n=3 Tax=Tilletia TaxID=13289 RepID=A0A8X7MZ48_9BASI|nr:hypothetical protein CF336_g677 [Tilletia laevis]KAE8204291.1 hypothetical protein CF328_g1163 [Tilletia controversa]KAE8265262.1 hypothetical protein A4X03_0g379 [Tilletia caries]KAE8208586.1 hypothetical protein CF335_g311 [Tilletia laevis]KAE8253191.1 hypothetical protein A4X06_0g1637 [Tilletia controversa]
MTTFDVQIACTPSPATLVHSQSFPAWSGLSKLALSSPTPSSCSGSGSEGESSGTESSLPSYSFHRHQSLTFNFPLPPDAGADNDEKVRESTDAESDLPCVSTVQPLQPHTQQEPSRHEPPAYIHRLDSESKAGAQTAGDFAEEQNILRLKQSLSLLQLPSETLQQFGQHFMAPAEGEEEIDSSKDAQHVGSQKSAHPPRLELAFDSNDDAPLNFDGHDLDRLATLLRGLPTQVDTPGRTDTLDTLRAEERARPAQSPILSGLLSATPSETVWEVDIALQPNKEQHLEGFGNSQKSGETAILRLELSPVEVAKLFSIPMEMPSPGIPFPTREVDGEFSVDDVYQGIMEVTDSSETAVIQPEAPLMRAVGTDQSATLTVDQAAMVFSSPALATPDLGMLSTPAMMDSWPTPVIAQYSTNFDSIARLLETAKPVGVTISAPELGRTRSEKGVLHIEEDPLEDTRSPQADEDRPETPSESPITSLPSSVSTPALSVLNRPRVKTRCDATTFFGTTRRDTERKLTASRSSTMASSSMPTSKSMGALALPSHLSDGSDRPSIPSRNSSQMCIITASPAPMDSPDKVQVAAASPDSCTYDITEDVHVHNNDSSPAAYWHETRQILDPNLGKHSALLDELRRQRTATLGTPLDQPQTLQPLPPVPPTPATLQKVRTPKNIKTSLSINTSAPSPTRSGFGGHIFKAFRRSPRSPPASIVIKSAELPSNIRPILVKSPSSTVGAVPMVPTASKTSVKTVLSTSTSHSVATAGPTTMNSSGSSTSFANNMARIPFSASPPVVLKGQALQEVKQACHQKAALIRAAAMVAAAEEQRAAASAAYRAAEAALLASRRQSATAAQQNISAGGGAVGTRPHSFHGHVAQILFAEAPERQYNVPSIRTVKSPPATAVAGRGRPVNLRQVSNVADTVLLAL